MHKASTSTRIKMNETSFVARTVQILVPEPCFTKIFTEFNFFDVACLKIIISKGLGFAIILGSILVKLPQILKILKAKSGDGISFWSVLFELIAISANWSYGYAKGFPFSAYGEGVFLAIQTSIVQFLVIYLGGNFLGSFGFLFGYGAIMSYLLSPMVPMEFLAAIQGVNIGIVILSKLLQVYSNYSNSSTGQLSAITVLMVFAGSIARIFTSIQETGDTMVIMMYVTSTLFNGLITAQLWYYWDKKPKAD